MIKFAIRFLCLQASRAISLPAASQRIVVEDLSHAPHGWITLGPAGADQIIRLSIALEAYGHDHLEENLLQISDPAHPRYGQHLSRDEASALIRPRQEAVESVRRWLSSANVPERQVHHRGHFVDATVTVQDAERLLAANYSIFERDGRKVVGTLGYSVPADVRPHIAAIQPTTFFDMAYYWKLRSWDQPKVKGKAYRSTDCGSNSADAQAQTGKEDVCTSLSTPACLRKLYHMKSDAAEPHPRSLLGVVGFNSQAAQYDQLNKYIEKFAADEKRANFTVALINNGTNPQGPNYPGGEANLDIQIAVAMAFKVPVRFYSTGGEYHDFNPDLDISDRQKEYVEPWLQFVSHMLELPDQELPQVMSISYGENEEAIPRPYAEKLCQMFGQLAIRGMSVIVASGDTGPGVSCQSNDGTDSTRFLPAFPATCPYVTSVGATDGRSPARALNFSSGGFSEYWSRPKWQDKDVNKYLNLHGEKWNKYYNRKGRGFPDVAAQGRGYPVFNHDKIEDAAGTSASAPLFASMIALINDDRLKKGKPALGFLNPWLYKAARGAFADVTDGRSEGCKGYSFSGAPAPRVAEAGWDAVEGWDPATGLGTPDFEKLHELAMNNSGLEGMALLLAEDEAMGQGRDLDANSNSVNSA